jgi:acyl carrier protein
MTTDELRDVILAVLGEIAPEATMADLDPDVRFRDQFEFSSVDFLNFTIKLQARLGVQIPETDCTRMASLSGCLAYLAPKCAQEEV